MLRACHIGVWVHAVEDLGSPRRSANEAFLEDALIVASARRVGATVVTWNVKDFHVIAEVLPHDATTPEALSQASGVS